MENQRLTDLDQMRAESMGPRPITVQAFRPHPLLANIKLPATVPLKDDKGNVIGTADVRQDGMATLRISDEQRIAEIQVGDVNFSALPLEILREYRDRLNEVIYDRQKASPERD